MGSEMCIRDRSCIFHKHSSIFSAPLLLLAVYGEMFLPQLFKDVDPDEVLNEWFERFLGIEKEGIYAYPLP